MVISTDQVKELRDATGVSVMQCKVALEEAGGDMEKALMILKKKSSDIAAKKADRTTADGIVVVKQSAGKAVILSLLCETDFVAKNADFQTLADTLADKALADGVEAMKAASAELISPVIQKIGENIQLGEVTLLEGPVLGTYVHNGKSGVVVSQTGGTETLARDIAMHIAAMKPEFLNKEAIPADKVSIMRDVFKKEVDATGKPEDIKAKMLAGKIDTYFKEQTLLDQPFIKNPEKTINALLQDANATINTYSFVRIG